MEQNKTVTLTSNNLPAIPDAESLAALRLDKSVPRYKGVPKEARIGWLKERILTLSMIRHQSIEPWQVEFDAGVLDEFIMDDHFASNYTFPEIWDAFKRGMMGDYGDYFGLTAESLYGFIKGYFMSEKKRKATEIVRKTLSPQEQPRGEYYLEKVRYHAALMAKNKKV